MKLQYLFYLLLMLPGLQPVLGQTEQLYGAHTQTNFDKSINAVIQPLSYYSTSLPTIKIPKRKYDSPFFCNELTPFKKGFIINSLSTSDRVSPDINYNFYYIDLASNKIYAIKTPLMDTIESIIVQEEKLFLSGRKNNSSAIIKIENNSATVLPAIPEPERTWTKLGIYKSNLLAFQKSGVFLFENNAWHKISVISVDEYYLQNGYKRSLAIIPTENIKINGNKLYFLHELTQGRDCNLLFFDLLKDTTIHELWRSYQLTDNTQKEIMSYEPVAEGAWIAAYRLMENSFLLKANENKMTAFIVNNRIASENNNQYGHYIKLSCVNKLQNDSLILVGENGIFLLYRDIVMPAMLFNNEPQDIKDGKSVLHFEFVPRCVRQTAAGQYLIGGLWGGLYLANTNKQTITCLDDLKKEPAETDIFSADF